MIYVLTQLLSGIFKVLNMSDPVLDLSMSLKSNLMTHLDSPYIISHWCSVVAHLIWPVLALFFFGGGEI